MGLKDASDDVKLRFSERRGLLNAVGHDQQSIPHLAVATPQNRVAGYPNGFQRFLPDQASSISSQFSLAQLLSGLQTSRAGPPWPAGEFLHMSWHAF